MTNKFTCDSETGVCRIPAIEPATHAISTCQQGVEIAYIGDPLCSWCWAVSPVVAALQGWCTEQNLRFTIIAGGLRPGGGDPWNDEFKAFLRHHWEEIGKVSGQPFSFNLFERDSFNYDSLPPCRAVVVARDLLAERDDNNLTLQKFFAAVQKRFYAQNDDPGKIDFYREPCAQNGIDFVAFSTDFNVPKSAEKARADFRLNRSWGINGFPGFALIKGDQAQILASGYVDLPTLTARIKQLLY
ncbi:DsbA family protein [Betaproteobacteria bacterium]|nr:DsbA family protein [Betaproteobacteria bacterium]